MFVNIFGQHLVICVVLFWNNIVRQSNELKGVYCTMAQITVRIPDEDRDKLEQIAQKEDRKISYIVRRAIQEYLNGIQAVKYEKD